MVEVKICGLTNADDVRVAQESGADYVGFVLYEASPRGISGMDLCRLLDDVTLTSKAVGVFVNKSRDEVEKIAKDCNLHAVQLHGDELPGDYEGMSPVVWRAVKFQNNTCVPAPEEWKVQRYVLDASVHGAYGGTGVTADWNDAAALARQHSIMLAGGLTLDNVAEAVARVMPVGVDTASGVESEPGKKDHEKVKNFIKAAKDAVTT
jgi:phosphoribosylanthranilate isomerase